MNKKIIIGIIVVLVMVVVWFIGQGDEPEQAPVAQEIINDQQAQDASNAGNQAESSEIQGEVKEFVVTGTNFKFSLDEIRVAEGDTVRIVFKNEDGFHDWKIDEFNAATQIIQTGQKETTIEFVANQVGEFEYYCSVGEHRKFGMKGTLIVE